MCVRWTVYESNPTIALIIFIIKFEFHTLLLLDHPNVPNATPLPQIIHLRVRRSYKETYNFSPEDDLWRVFTYCLQKFGIAQCTCTYYIKYMPS